MIGNENEDESSDMEKSVVDGEVVNKKEKSHEREGWKVLGFGIAWF
jgi:hypothetical protein